MMTLHYNRSRHGDFFEKAMSLQHRSAVYDGDSTEVQEQPQSTVDCGTPHDSEFIIVYFKFKFINLFYLFIYLFNIHENTVV